ncbi:MAG TPA: hypothetical protein VKR83_19495 [Ktedonobacteraceae bacterium]|nr:hypothetical protein [Ktedonobacteraceae bacterium]
MATTGELRTIIQEMHLVDLGDAESYLGEEDTVVEESLVPADPTYLFSEPVTVALLLSGDCATCQYI